MVNKQKNVKNKNLYNFDYVSKEENKKKKAKKKADAKSASKKNGQAVKEKKYDDEIIIGVTKYPKKEQTEKTKNKKLNHSNKKQKKPAKQIENRQAKKQEKKQPERIIEKPVEYENLKERKRPKKKSHSKLIKGLILIALVTGTTTFAMLSPIFNITNIEVTGNTQISKDTIISLSQIYIGENIFRISKGKITTNIKENAYIKNVSISKKLPSTIEINVEERQPTFQIIYGNGYIYINNQGYMLEVATVKKEIPILLGIKTSQEDLKAGNRLDEEDLNKLGTVIRIMNAAQAKEIAKSITSIDIADESNFTLHFEEERKIAYLGDCSDLETRMLFLVAILNKEKEAEGEIFVNMNLNTDDAFFREKV